MSKKQYLKALNQEIQKLNGVIDLKIIHGEDYRGEALRHKKMLAKIRRQEVRTSMTQLYRVLVPSWF